jgi:predicted transposase YdaD
MDYGAGIKRREMDALRRADLLTTLGIFGRLKDRTLDVLSIIGREQMRESPFYQQLVEEGEQVRARKDVLQALQLRFGDDAVAEFEALVNRLDNLDQLSGLHKLAIQSRRLSQFRKGFPRP